MIKHAYQRRAEGGEVNLSQSKGHVVVIVESRRYQARHRIAQSVYLGRDKKIRDVYSRLADGIHEVGMNGRHGREKSPLLAG